MKNPLLLLKKIIPTLALAALMLTPVLGWGQTYLLQEGFTTTSVPSGWAGDVYFNATANHGTLTGGNGAGFNATDKYLETPVVNTSGTLTFWMKGSSATSQISLRVLKKIGAGEWTTIADYPKPNNSTWTEKTVLIEDINNDISLKFEAYDRSGNSIYIDDIQLTNYEGGSTPSISVTPTSLTGFTYVEGSGPSAEQTFTVSGTDLTNDVNIAASTNYEISKTSGSAYTTPISFTPAEVALSPSVYVRLKSGLATGNYNSETITATSTGATNKTVTCSGSVTSPALPEPSNHVTDFIADVATPTFSALDVVWTDASGTTIPEGYVIKASDVSYVAITAPVDGTPETPGTLIKVVGPGLEEVNFSGLDENTTYYFKIWPFTNAGSEIDYKTDGSVPEATATTDEAPVLTVINFDDEAKWTAGSASITSYATDHTYIDGVFSSTGGPALRNTTSTQDGFAGALGTYSWRLENNASVSWIITITSGGVSDFFMDIRRWDGSPSPAFTLDYSIDDGVAWNNVTTIDNDNLNNSSAWKTFSGTVNSGVNNILIRLQATGSTERIMVDNFSWSPFASEPLTSTYTGTGNWSEVANWSNGIPTASVNAIVNGNVTVDDASECNDLTINPVGSISVTSGEILDINGDFFIQSDATATGSFISSGLDYLIGGTTSIQRYLTGGWDDWDAGWHQISSPVAAQAISAFETTGAGNDYDFYGWNEPTNMWINYKDAGFSAWNGGVNFNVGQGYLVSYEAANITETFSGVLNSGDVIIEDLSNVGTSYNGWHLLGNPYASALIWNDANWILDQVAGTAKIWHEANKSYSDIAPLGIIPSAQGFMLQVESALNFIGIPAASRTHNSTPYYKSANEQLLLVAAESEGGSAQESKIVVNSMATEGFDFDYDSRFLAGYAPVFYSVVGDEMLSTNSLPELNSSQVIPFGFVKNAATAFTIELKESLPGRIVYLTDNKTSVVTNLTETPVYSFTSEEGDDANRFLLSFGTVGINNPDVTAQFEAYTYVGQLYLNGIEAGSEISLRSISGQMVQQSRTTKEGLNTMDISRLPKGVYVVTVTNGKQTSSRKVVL